MGRNPDAKERGADVWHVSQGLCVRRSQKAVETPGQFVCAIREIEHTALRRRFPSTCHMLCRVAAWLQ